ncbi:hypothetical protein PENANT_c001G03478 [Penicillium antarcticum]|uniref:DDE-1 domain-containing protein n=1 Tax=Penicillium antarcticum TaxID=416450 RepID=A0A1V6QPM6_9EURO|nr:uncharacterized protein N7508_010253 [Penicillium antarcticum]KAJ5295432.1 hypothetical protein N7508_010253 [Penicillium antarcticum]OQD91148.1 hypothetical protein PENANT_c001G03478 [Penicillium antarcticum]
MLIVEGIPPSREIAIEVAVNIAGAALRRRSGVMGGPPAVDEEKGKKIVEHVKRWIEHGFDSNVALVKDIANAYFDLLLGDTERRRQNLGMGWQTSFVKNNKELSELFKEPKSERDAEKIQRGHRNDSAERFFSIYSDFKRRHRVTSDDVHALAEAAYQTSVYKKHNLVFARPRRSRGRIEERQFCSVIHCCSSRGRHLLPYIVRRSKNPPQTRVFRSITISSNESGWAEPAHALDWLRNVFEPKTRPPPRSDHSLRWRILLVSRGFSVNPEFEQYCWQKSILCLPFPQIDQKFINPMGNIAVRAMGPSYTDFMMQKFVDKQNVSMEENEFVKWIQDEINSSKRAEEATNYWEQSCLVPPDINRLRNCLQGNRPTAVPDETDSTTSTGPRVNSARAQVSMTQTPRTSCTPIAASTPRTSVPLPTIEVIEMGKRDDSVEESSLQLQDSLQEDIDPSRTEYPEGDGSSDREGESESDTASVTYVSQPATPSRTPRRPKATPKTPKSATSMPNNAEQSGSVMSYDKYIEYLDDCLAETPRKRQKFRHLMTDRARIQEENTELKAKVDMLSLFVSMKK